MVFTLDKSCTVENSLFDKPNRNVCNGIRGASTNQTLQLKQSSINGLQRNTLHDRNNRTPLGLRCVVPIANLHVDVHRLNLVILVLEKCIFQRKIHSSKIRTEIGRFVKKVFAKPAMSTTLWLCLFFCYRQSHIVTRIFAEEAPSNTESQQGMKRLENQFDAIAAKLRRNPM